MSVAGERDLLSHRPLMCEPPLTPSPALAESGGTSLNAKTALIAGNGTPVVRGAVDSNREIFELSWDFVASCRVTDTRYDKIQSAFWRDSVRRRSDHCW